MTDAQTTFARATLEYDEMHDRALMEAITRTILESSTVTDANAIVIRTGEIAEALLTVLAGILAMSPAVCAPTAIRKTVDELGKRLRRHIAAAEGSKVFQKFIRRTFRGNDVEGTA